MAYVSDITAMNVDVVVNTVDGQINLNTGLAAAIKTAGGPELEKECQEFIRVHKQLYISEVCITTAGNMKSKKVIHTSGPEWKGYEHDVCIKQLHQTFTNVLTTANHQGFQSIAIPAIGTGASAIPASIVANIAITSITLYLKENANQSLRKIYLMDTDENKVSLFHEELMQFVPSEYCRYELQRSGGLMMKTAHPINLSRQQSVSLPSHWDDIEGHQPFTLVQLPSGSAEYQSVCASFQHTCKRRIYRPVRQIHRLQNRLLYQRFMVHKDHMDHVNPGTVNERQLWHGTAPDTLSEINTTGFNRSFCGRHGVTYGRGVYFARDAAFSAKYATSDTNGNKYMYYCRVLTGEYTNGNDSLIVPPPKDQSQPNIKYDSVVNDVNDPSIFVIFQDTQAYPAYLVTF